MTKDQRSQSIVLASFFVLALLVLLPTFGPAVFGKDFSLPEWWPSKKIKLGLDLQGGTYLVLGVQSHEAVKSQLVSIASTVKSEMREQRIGLVRARPSGDRALQVTLLSDRGVDQLDAYMSKNFSILTRGERVSGEGGQVNITYQLRADEAVNIERGAVEQAIETIRNRVDQFGVTEPTIQRSGENRIVVQLPSITQLDNVKKTIGSVAKLEFRLVADPNKPTTETLQVRTRDGGSLQVEDEILMTGDAIDVARVEPDPQTNEMAVSLKFNSVGAKRFDRITSENVGRRLAILLDGVSQTDPRINERIPGGTAQITGSFTVEDAHRLAIVLRSGALPAPMTFEEQRTVGASLGADSIRRGIVATLVGSLCVIIFMVIYYKKAGALAVACLFINLLWLLALLALCGATLTLPGIAGLALTIGMAVDANIIIFERIREELRNGSSPKAAVDAGFLRAHWTILDANITTLISGIILYGFGSGPIKGFAVTLSLGILTTVITALFASKLGFSVFRLRNAKDELSI